MEKQGCLKCGKEVLAEQSFCEECLADMEMRPVKPGTSALLPHRATDGPVTHQKNRWRLYKPEEQITALKRRVLVLSIALVLALTAFILTAILALNLMRQLNIALIPDLDLKIFRAAMDIHS